MITQSDRQRVTQQLLRAQKGEVSQNKNNKTPRLSFLEQFPNISNNYKNINHSVIQEESSEQTLDGNSTPNYTLNNNQSRKLVINHVDPSDQPSIKAGSSRESHDAPQKSEPINEESESEPSVSEDSIDIEDYHEVLVDECINQEIPLQEGDDAIKKVIKEIARDIKAQKRIKDKSKQELAENNP